MDNLNKYLNVQRIMKKGQAIPTLIKWVIALVVLITLIAGIYFQKEKIVSIIQKFSEILRFR